jgi:Tol biopolymer transport system component
LGVPRCSPGGDFLAYSANVGKEWFLYVTDFSTTYEIDPPDGLISGYSSWPAFGTDFLFQVITQEDRINLIYRMSGHPSGGQYAKIDSGANPSLSPDGSRMVYSCEMVGNDRTLCISNADGSNSQSLVTVIRIDVPGVGWNIQPASAWSGDGSWVYYASADDRDWDIYRIRPDGSDRQNLTDHLGSANEINPALKW